MFENLGEAASEKYSFCQKPKNKKKFQSFQLFDKFFVRSDKSNMIFGILDENYEGNPSAQEFSVPDSYNWKQRLEMSRKG